MQDRYAHASASGSSDDSRQYSLSPGSQVAQLYNIFIDYGAMDGCRSSFLQQLSVSFAALPRGWPRYNPGGIAYLCLQMADHAEFGFLDLIRIATFWGRSLGE